MRTISTFRFSGSSPRLAGFSTLGRLGVAFCLLCLVGHLSAQNHATTLRKHRNTPQAGDSIIKQQVAFIDPGASGSDITWDFRTVHPVNDAYNLRYKAVTPDTLQIAGIEHRTIYRYKVKGDSLLHTGYENSTTLMNYPEPELKMRFPFHYQDTMLLPRVRTEFSQDKI